MTNLPFFNIRATSTQVRGQKRQKRQVENVAWRKSPSGLLHQVSRFCYHRMLAKIISVLRTQPAWMATQTEVTCVNVLLVSQETTVSKVKYRKIKMSILFTFSHIMLPKGWTKVFVFKLIQLTHSPKDCAIFGLTVQNTMSIWSDFTCLANQHTKKLSQY